MNDQLDSAALQSILASIDAGIFEARDLHLAAEAAAREATSYNLATVTIMGDADLLTVPSTSDTAARIDELHRAREVAVEMLARAQEAERLARVETSRNQLRAVTKTMKAEAVVIDAMFADLAKAIVGFGTLQREAEAILRAQLGVNPLPVNFASDIAKSVGAFIAASTGAFPPDCKPIAAPHADKFASRSLSDAGAI